MTISSSLNASVAGLAANATRLAAISDNIANSATYGYKRVVTDFHSLVGESGRGTYAAGGVRTTNMRLVDQSGSLISTSNATDLAVRGRGFLPVTTETAVNAANGQLPMYMSTTGSFRTDDQGYLRTTSGLILMGWPANLDGTIPNYARDTASGLEPIRINANQFTGEPTTEMQVVVNLPASSTEAGSTTGDEQLTVEYYDNLGRSATMAVEFTPDVPTSGASNTWTMTLRDSASGGAIVGEYTLEFDDSRASGALLLNVTPVSGGAYDPVTGIISASVAGGPMDVSIGAIGSPLGMTQLSDSFAPVSISKNGTAVGNMTAVEVDPNGYVRATFDTGVNRVIYQVPLADVPNPNGVEPLDYQTFAVTPDSGDFYLWDAGDGPTGDIVGFAREESSTDVAGELTNLIQTQRAYSSNTKVIQTVDEMLQETTNIKR